MSYTWNHEFVKAKVSHKNEWEQGVEERRSFHGSFSLAPRQLGQLGQARVTAVAALLSVRVIEKNIHR